MCAAVIDAATRTEIAGSCLTIASGDQVLAARKIGLVASEAESSSMACASGSIVVISLPTAMGRRQEIDASLTRSAMKWTFFDAHTQLLEPLLSYDAGEAKRHAGFALSRQQIAVYSSHYAVLHRFTEDGSDDDFIFVLEDDVILDQDFPVQEFASKCLSMGMHFVKLFAKSVTPMSHIGFFYDRDLVRYHRSPCGAQAYIVSRDGAHQFVKKLSRIAMPIDVAMDRFWESELPLYGIFPYPVIERFSATQIPIPSLGQDLTRRDRWVWLGNRAIDKVCRVAANQKLNTSDQLIRQAAGNFSQITDTNVGGARANTR